MGDKMSLRGVSLDEVVDAVASWLMASEREMGLSDDYEGIGSSADKKNQAEADQEMSKIHISPNLKDK